MTKSDEMKQWLSHCGKKVVKILSEFPVMYMGWEMDQRGWSVEFENGERAIILTSHNSPYVASKKEVKQKVTEYKASLNGIEKAIWYLKEKR